MSAVGQMITLILWFFYEGWKCEKETQLPPFYYGTSEDISRTEAVTALSRKGKT